METLALKMFGLAKVNLNLFIFLNQSSLTLAYLSYFNLRSHGIIACSSSELQRWIP